MGRDCRIFVATMAAVLLCTPASGWAQGLREPIVQPAATYRDWRVLTEPPPALAAADPPPPLARPDEGASPSDKPLPKNGNYTPSPSDLPLPMPMLPGLEPSCNSQPSCLDDCDCDFGCGCGCRVPPVDPWWVDRALGRTGCSPWRIGGWIEAGAVANGDSPASDYNGIVGYADRDRIQMNQAWIFAERATNTCGCGWDFGGRIDFLYGTDAQFLQAAGLERSQNGDPHWNAVGQDYQIALPQAYGEVAYNDLSIKLGRFASPLGYESIMSPYNFFYTRSLARQYAVPATQFGGLATWKANQNYSILLGLTNGWDTWGQVNPWTSVLGGIILHPCDRPWNLQVVFNVGGDDADFDLSNGVQEAPRYVTSAVWTWLVNDCWTYAIHGDVGIQHDALGPNVDAEWYAINQYLYYCINDRWSAGFRFEWFRDDDGVRVASLDPGNPNVGPFVGNFYEITAGLNWRPTDRLVVRPELRYDWFDGIGSPFDDGTSDNQFLAAVDLIWLF